jgi:hypothetical protein
MLSFNITAIDIILAIAVIILTILYLKKTQDFPEELSLRSLTKNLKQQHHTSDFQDDFAEMPTSCQNNNEFSENSTFSEATLDKITMIQKDSENK